MTMTELGRNSIGTDVGRSRPKTVVVTGAAGAIGQAIAHEFRGRGYRVFGIDITPSTDGLEVDGYLEIDLAKLAQASEDERRLLLSDVLTWLGDSGLDVLVNNAAVQLLGSFEDLEVDAWRATLEVNLLAPFFLVKTLLGPLEKVHGSVVNISSIHARATKPGFVAYATSKAALSGLTRAMAVELGPRIRVNAIEPASVVTPMLMASFKGNSDAFNDLVDCHPQERLVTPQEVASLVSTLSIGNLTSVHGACIDLSGGISARLHDPL